jgi:SAM-dependent methyltransferase
MMGRFASTVKFYARYREPYPPEFFKQSAEQIALRGDETLLDVGCGPGLLAIGFAPFVGRCTGLDPEAAMIAAARAAAAATGVELSLIHGRIEELPTIQTYDVITIGRALHWMGRSATLPVLEQIVSDSGRILICGASGVETPETAWVKSYKEVCRAWRSRPDERRGNDGTEWFAGSCFRGLGKASVTICRQVTIADLIGRALSKSSTSSEILAKGQARFETEIAAALEPFVQDGVLQEQIVARASIFGHR